MIFTLLQLGKSCGRDILLAAQIRNTDCHVEAVVSIALLIHS